MSSIEELLKQGVSAARVGRRANAHALLMRVVEADPYNEEAWLWLSAVVDDPADQRVCLQNVLDINPHNLHAQRGITLLDQKQKESEMQPSAAGASLSTQFAQASTLGGSTTNYAVEAVPPFKSEQPLAITNLPCPYCGAPTTLLQRSCTQCNHTLMILGALPEKRSIPLIILVGLWGLSTLLSLLFGILQVVVEIIIIQQQQAHTQDQPTIIEPLLTTILRMILSSLLGLMITRGLWHRRSWAYIVHTVLISLSCLGIITGILLIVFMPNTIQALSLNSDIPKAISALLVFFGIALFCSFIINALTVVLTIFSYRDFYAPKVRFIADIPKRSHEGHYNMGVTYKNKGMWYMAAQEWEAALKKKADDVTYRHALGLAYAQLKQFDRALRELHAALQSAPHDLRLQESITIVERNASGKD